MAPVRNPKTEWAGSGDFFQGKSVQRPEIWWRIQINSVYEKFFSPETTDSLFADARFSPFLIRKLPGKDHASAAGQRRYGSSA